MNPALSVVVPVQEHACLASTLQALATQQCVSHSDYEVIVIDSLHLYDWTECIADIRSRHPTLELRFLLLTKCASRARQLNAGISEARADLLLMLADDFIPEPALVSLHLQAHRGDPDPHLAAIGPGLFRKGGSTTDFMRWLENSGSLFGVPFTRPDLVKLPDSFFYMANTSIKRSLLTQAGPFDEDFPYDSMDDFEMGLRLQGLGMRTTYLPAAIAIHEHHISFQERCNSMQKAGESAAIYDAKHADPGPWSRLLNTPRVPHARRRKESLEQRYWRVLNDHFRSGYKARVARIAHN